MAAPISRAAVGQDFWKFSVGCWSTDGARHRSSRGRAKASGILGRPLRHRGRGLRSTEVEHFCGEVRADGWPTSVASSEVCFLLCGACFKWPCGRFRRQAVSRQWFFSDRALVGVSAGKQSPGIGFFLIGPWRVILPASRRLKPFLRISSNFIDNLCFSSILHLERRADLGLAALE